MRLVFDIETDGLLREDRGKPAATRVHCLVLKDIDLGEVWSCHEHGGDCSLRDGLQMLKQADWICGHNVVTFDIPVLKKFFPNFKPTGKVFDTLIASRLIWTDIKDRDFKLYKNGTLPQPAVGSHSLEAWGYRLGLLKGEFGKKTDWKNWSREMQEYCERDVDVTERLLKKIESLNYSEMSLDLEHEFQDVIFRQEQFGFRFDHAAAVALQSKLAQRRQEVTVELQKGFKPTVIEMKTPEYYTGEVELDDGISHQRYPTKTEASRAGLRKIKPGPLKKKIIPFNPGSRDQIADRLKELLGWVPTKFTDSGKPQVDETVLDGIDAPEAKLLNEYLLVNKRLGQLAEGDEAWLKLEKNGRIYGRVITNGAVTGRCTHMKPNVSQTPAVTAPYGTECRACYTVDEGNVLVGADASGLELRMLGHFMAPFDDGDYGKIVISGDVHSANRDAAGFPATKEGRQQAKVFIYALCYGAGDHKLGTISGVTPEEIKEFKSSPAWAKKVSKLKHKGEPHDEQTVGLIFKGMQLRDRFMSGLPAFAKLISRLEDTLVENGMHRTETGFLVGKATIRGLDGRRLNIRSSHSALNTLLQSAGALCVKKATCLLFDHLTSEGFTFGKEYALVAHIHDEMQLQVREDLAERVGRFAVQSIREAGEFFKLRVPLDGEFKIGRNWAETH